MSKIQAHIMELPRRVVVGYEILGSVGKICNELGFSRRALVISGPRTFKIAGANAIDSLKEAGFEVENLTVSEATMKSVKEAQRRVKASRSEVALGVGGGKVIDVTKYSSALEGIPFISIPTAATHDGIASPQASITGLKGSVSVKAQAPMAILADIAVIAKAPYRLTASGCGDIIAKYTAVRDWWLAHFLRNEYYGDYAADLALMSAKLITRNSDIIKEGSDEGVRVVVEALISCGVAISIAGSTRPCSGSEHLFSHALDEIAPKPALHGEQSGVGTIMMAHLHHMNWRKIESALVKVGAPTTAAELGIEDDLVVRGLTRAHLVRPERYTILGERGLGEDTARKLARETGVIKR